MWENNDIKTVLVSEEQIQQRAKELGEQLLKVDYLYNLL